MNILVIGNGGREHALVWKLKDSPQKPKIYCAPGNAGISREAECVDIPATDIDGLLQFAKNKAIDLTIVGPEAPLALGIVDLFQEGGLKIFGPTKNAAQLESSKAFTKEFCARHNIPKASYYLFDDSASAKEWLQITTYPKVVKADGLANGKGVFICQNKKEALEAVEQLMVKKVFGNAGGRIIIEEFLVGEEVSFMAFVDGTHIVPLSSAKDYKRLSDGDLGPNTGGMGAYSPATTLSPALYDKVLQEIIQPTVDGMALEGAPFVGILYAGLMLCKEGPKLLEYNVRLGDPETEVILPRLKTDLIDIIFATLQGKLKNVHLSWETKFCCCVVMAQTGYPGKYPTGFKIQGLDSSNRSLGSDAMIFHSGTKLKNGDVVTAGGRVLAVCALGADLQSASDNAYNVVRDISWEGCTFRRDIGKKNPERGE